jgi:protein involved in polysaccharide export with SLBB domain
MPGTHRIFGAIVAALLSASATEAGTAEYRLGPGDRVKVTVFGEDDLSGEFEVDGSGRVSMPLIGAAQSGGLTVRELEARLSDRLREYLVAPKLAIEVLNYRPFYILGEVESPGSYPYRAGMTVLNAVVMAGGYTYRADEEDITIQRGGSATDAAAATPEAEVLPGDVIRVEERFF